MDNPKQFIITAYTIIGSDRTIIFKSGFDTGRWTLAEIMDEVKGVLDGTGADCLEIRRSNIKEI